MTSFKPRQSEKSGDNSDAIWNVQLPLDVNWGIYARQSTPAQVIKNIQSTEMQTDALIDWLRIRGVSQVTLFDADLGVSGTKRIDERTGLQDLVDKIKRDIIKAVLVYQISRLFRDESGVQYNVFADICRKHNCILVTADGMIFNFKNPMHLKMFRFLAEMAAEYIPQQIHLLHQARERKARKGLFALGSIARGYVVDRNPRSESHGKYTAYPPHASVVLELFKRFYMLDGDLSSLERELEQESVLFLPFENPQDAGSRRMKRVKGGYHLSRSGLIHILTNPVYIGWWIVGGDIISRNNHERIIPIEDEHLFWFAFDCLSEYTTEGEINQRKRGGEKRRYYKRSTTEEGGLLKDRITGENGRSVYVHLSSGAAAQPYYLLKRESDPSMHWHRERGVTVALIDDEFSKRFFEHLSKTRYLDQYQQFLADATKQHQSTIAIIETEIEEAERQHQEALDEVLAIRRDTNRQIEALKQANPQMEEMAIEAARATIEEENAPTVRGLRKRIATSENSLSLLRPKLEETKKSVPKKPKYGNFQEELALLKETWHEKEMKDKRCFVNLFIDCCILTFASPHWVQLDIQWALPGWESDSLYMYQRHGTNVTWTEEERAIVTDWAKYTQLELLQRLPNKTWGAIRVEAWSRQVGRPRAEKREKERLPQNITYQDYLFLKEKGFPITSRYTICVTGSPARVTNGISDPDAWETLTNQLYLLFQHSAARHAS